MESGAKQKGQNKSSTRANMFEVNDIASLVDDLKISNDNKQRQKKELQVKGFIPRGLDDYHAGFHGSPYTHDRSYYNKQLGPGAQYGGFKPHTTSNPAAHLPRFPELLVKQVQNDTHMQHASTGHNFKQGQNGYALNSVFQMGPMSIKQTNYQGDSGMHLTNGQNGLHARYTGQNASQVVKGQNGLTKHTVSAEDTHCIDKESKFTIGQNFRRHDRVEGLNQGNDNSIDDALIPNICETVGENQILGVQRVMEYLQKGTEIQPTASPNDIRDVVDVILKDTEAAASASFAASEKKKRRGSKDETISSKQPRYAEDDELVEAIAICQTRLKQNIRRNKMEETRSILEEYAGTEVFQEFLKNGGEENLLKSATLGNNVDLMRLLLEFGLNPNTECSIEEGPLKVYKTPVHLAATEGNLQVLEVLLAHPGVDIDKISTRGMTALHHAVKSHTPPTLQVGEKFDNSAVILTLLHYGASVNITDSGHGRNFFHHLMETGDIKLMRRIFSFYDKNDVTSFLNTRTKGNDTCYHLAHRFKRNSILFEEICELLRENRAECKASAKKH